MLIETHLLQNFAPSNLNRDDTGSPKDAEFGCYRRARISSQCQKRAIRGYFRDHNLIPPANLAARTKRLADTLAQRLRDKGRDEQAAVRAARAAVSAFLPKSEDKAEHKTPYLLFLGENEIARFADLVEKHWTAFSEAPTGPAPVPAADKPAARRKKGAADNDAPKAPEGFIRSVAELLDGGGAADLALFGRMLADLPERNVNAACQVAHAISTNQIHSVSMDYYTAVDDLKPDDTAGADMIGTIEFNSACFYRYASLDVRELIGGFRDDKKKQPFGLHGDVDLARTTARAFLKAFIRAIPTGKQNTFAAHNPPSLVFAVVREGQPLSLANAFVSPVVARHGESLTAKSIAALDDFYGRLVKMYGEGGLKKSAVSQMDSASLRHLGQDGGSVDQLVDTVVADAFAAGGTA